MAEKSSTTKGLERTFHRAQKNGGILTKGGMPPAEKNLKRLALGPEAL